MSKMSEMDMMVQDAVDMVENDGMYLVQAMQRVKAMWALDQEEYYLVYEEATARVYP